MRSATAREPSRPGPGQGTSGTDAVATITGFRIVDGAIQAVGTVTGQVTTLVGGVPTTTTVTDQPFTAPVTILQQTASCRILELDLGPIHLDVLGLVVDLSDVHLDIVAQPGAGNLLGNLLCAIAGLLDSNAAGAALQRVVDLLNQILAA